METDAALLHNSDTGDMYVRSVELYDPHKYDPSELAADAYATAMDSCCVPTEAFSHVLPFSVFGDFGFSKKNVDHLGW